MKSIKSILPVAFMDNDDVPPFRLIARPPQFPDGKTKTAITEMENMMKWFMDEGNIRQRILVTTAKQRGYKRIVHLVFTNNSLIESDQWRDRMITRGVQNLRIFSSKSDVSTKEQLKQLITEGDYNVMTDQYVQTDYVLMCTHPVRLMDFSKRGEGILSRIKNFNKDIGFMLWFDEIDKAKELLKTHIPIFKEVGNVIAMTGITATPYCRFWELMHECGYTELDLIGTLPAATDYRSFKDHNLQYTDNINIKSPAKHFQYLMENPGELMAKIKDKDGGVRSFHVPANLADNKGRIFFVPGEITKKSHLEIKDIANKYEKNTFVINGTHKAFFKADGSEPIDVRTVKRARLRELQNQIKDAENESKASSLKKLYETEDSKAIMDIAIEIYNDPAFGLCNQDLVITGFYCVERGVTFNRPNFQFNFVIMSPYHYTERSEEIESIIQLSGRAFGNKAWVPKGITILAPKYMLDEVEQNVNNLIKFLHEKHDTIQYADIYREINGIPIHFTITNKTILSEISNFGRLTDKKKFMSILKKALENGHILLDDKNKVDSVRLPFSFDKYNIDTKRILTDIKKAKNYRFPQFMDHYTRRVAYGQSIQDKGKFTMDLTMVNIELEDGEKIEAGTGFISFSYLPRPTIDAHTSTCKDSIDCTCSTSRPQVFKDDDEENEEDEKYERQAPVIDEKAAQAAGGSREFTKRK